MLASFSLWTWAVNFRSQRIQFKFNKIASVKMKNTNTIISYKVKIVAFITLYSIENIN